jgi:hypothetical protein
MSEGKSRASRFRRSRFRTSKASQGEGGEAEQQQEAGGEEPEQPQLLQQQVIQEQPEIQPPMAVPQAPARVVKVPLNTLLQLTLRNGFRPVPAVKWSNLPIGARYERRVSNAEFTWFLLFFAGIM